MKILLPMRGMAMTKDTFQQLNLKKEAFLYHSFQYVEFDQIQDYDVVVETKELI